MKMAPPPLAVLRMPILFKNTELLTTEKEFYNIATAVPN
jgi:hypothetical protein